MSVYEPPLKDVPIFDSYRDNFIRKDELLTQQNSPFIRFPKAQGDVRLKDVNAKNIEVDGDLVLNSIRTPDKFVSSWVTKQATTQTWKDGYDLVS